MYLFQVLGWRVALRFLSLLAVFITYYLEIADCDIQNKVVDKLAHLDVSDLNLTSLTSLSDPTSCSCSNPLYVCWPVALGQECFKLVIGWLLGSVTSDMPNLVL